MALKKATVKPRRSLPVRILTWTVLVGLMLAAAGAATLATTFWIYGADPDLPHIRTLKDYTPKQTTRILSADGKVIGEVFEERRTYVTLDKIAPIMAQAAIDAEDAGFRSHSG